MWMELSHIQPIDRLPGSMVYPAQQPVIWLLEEIVDEFCDYMNVHTISYQSVFTLHINLCWPGKRSGIGTEPEKSG